MHCTLLKDMNVAESHQINGTPTVFINGHRIQGVESAAKLREMIAEAERGRNSTRFPDNGWFAIVFANKRSLLYALRTSRVY